MGGGEGVTGPDQRTRRTVYWGEWLTGGVCWPGQRTKTTGRGDVTGPIRVSEERLTGGCWKNGLLGVAGRKANWGLLARPEYQKNGLLGGGGGLLARPEYQKNGLLGGGGGGGGC